MDKLIFISSPYSHGDKSIEKLRYELVSKYSAELVSNGIVAFSPITYGHTLVGFKNMRTDFEFWKNFCLTFLSKCDELHVLKIEGWDLSIGLKMEVEYAIKNGINVVYIDIN
jgi:hypothetical protein